MELELDLEFDKKKAGFMILGLLLGIGITVGYNEIPEDGQQESNQLVDFLENQTGQDLELVNTEEAGTYFKVDVRTTENQLSTYYTNGEMFTANMQSIGSIQRQVAALTEFQGCLANSGTVMFGNGSQQATQSQIQALGGVQAVGPIYKDVRTNNTLAQAAQLGIRRVPAFYKNGSALQGIQTLQQIEEFTGCSYQTPEEN
jgi:hypothetical protein